MFKSEVTIIVFLSQHFFTFSDKVSFLKKIEYFILKENMQQVPLDLKVSPSTVEDIDTWKSQLLWKPMTKDQIVDFIRSNIKPHPEVKSGVVLYRDFDLNCFQQISFTARAIVQPEEADAVVKLKRPEPARKPLTFEQKTEALAAFIAQTGRVPNDQDKFEGGTNLYLFYKSLERNKCKYEDILNNCKSDHSDDGSGENAASGGDDGLVGGRGRVLGRRGDVEEEIILEEVPEDEIPAKKASKKKAK